MLGDEEKIMGYEGLQVIIYLSSKQLIPYIEIHWLNKAPVVTKVDDILAKLTKHYGTIHTDKNEFVTKVLKEEQNFQKPGQTYAYPPLDAKGFEIR